MSDYSSDYRDYYSLAPPLRRAGEGERAEESGDTAIQSVAERNAIIGSY